MKTNISKKIAEELESGLTVFLHCDNQNFMAIPNFNEVEENIELWEAEITELKNNPKNWTEILKWNSKEEFEFISEFINDTIKDEKLQNELTITLQNPKPFRNFKFAIEKNEKYRDKWFDFIAGKHQKYIENKIETINR